MVIDINDNCIKCNRCVEICPSSIFKISQEKNKKVQVINPESCILCGHCVSVCPQDAIEHSEFPLDKIHKFSYEDYPSPKQMMTLIRGRRSNRAFSKKPVSQEDLELICEAAYRAPTASNSQMKSITIITRPEDIQKVIKITIDTYSHILKILENPIVKLVLKPFMRSSYAQLSKLHRLIKSYENGQDKVLHDATSLIFFHAPASIGFGRDDANLAYQNASLMAESLGISHFYTGFVIEGTRLNKKALKKALGIHGNIYAGMALGQPKFRYHSYTDRKPSSINFL